MKDKAHKPLIVKGARQIGKTESILHFANENYHNVIYINFVLDKKYSKIVNDGYDVICSGSMLGINYKRIHSNSVGNKTDYEMYSMDFEEFLWAKGYQDAQIHEILNHMLELRPFRDTELQVYKTLFLDYCVLGGMPDVVRGYIETGTFSGSLDTQEQIRLDYEENATLEEDFFVRTQSELIPVEVKSNNDSSKSLSTLIRSDHYADIRHGIKLGDFNIGFANNIYTFPYFCAFMLKEYLKTWN